MEGHGKAAAEGGGVPGLLELVLNRRDEAEVLDFARRANDKDATRLVGGIGFVGLKQM